jgi:Fe-S-cluster containining protein
VPLEILKTLPISELEKTGFCNRFCGRCCNLAHWQQHPLYETVKNILEAPPFIGMNERGDCNHLQWRNGQAVCGIYETRPEICRDFPVHPLSIDTIPECTVTFRVKD